MENKQENLMAVLSSRRRQNAKQQLKSILLETYEIFGSDFVEEVQKECSVIYKEFVNMSEDLPDA